MSGRQRADLQEIDSKRWVGPTCQRVDLGRLELLAITGSKRNHRTFLGQSFMLLRQCFKAIRWKQWL